MEILVAFAVLIPYIAVFGLIFRKMGFPFAAGMLMIIPLINLVWLIYLASADWPIHERIAELRDHEDKRSDDALALM